MHDRLQVLAGSLVAEHDRGERRTIELSVGPQYPTAELRDHRVEGRRPPGDRVPGERVGVQHDGASIRQESSDGRFPRADPSRETDEEHGATSEAGLPAGPSVVAALAPLQVLEDRLERDLVV